MLKPLLTQEDVAAFLHCSEATVRRLVDRKALGCHFINRARRFTQGHLDEYLRLVASRPPEKALQSATCTDASRGLAESCPVGQA